MCSYCGCEAEPVIRSLSDDHAAIGLRITWITDALGRGDVETVRREVAELYDFFDHHRRVEEAGLFTELRAAGEAGEELDRLTAEHRDLLAELRRAAATGQWTALEVALRGLHLHAEVEDTDLFPFAMQVLPNERWDTVEQVHQEMLTA